MSVTTNSLVAKAKKFGAPAAAAAAVILSASFLIGYTAHAAGNAVAPNGAAAALSGGAPMDDSSVSSLVSLDNAVEAVAARVTPAVVNVAVTARVSDKEADGDDDGQDSGGQIPQSAIPPEFRRFFGPMGTRAESPVADRTRHRQRHHHFAGRLHRDQQSRGGWRNADPRDAE